jgi:indolepyruvate ferredoxin oxidoreductase
VREYLAKLDDLVADLTPANYPAAVAIASIPEKIRGYGPVKARSLKVARAEEKGLWDQFRSGAAAFLKAAE